MLEAQALNDLGRSDEALERVDAALRIAPGRGDALHEKGVALFDLSRFADAKTVLQKALTIQPDDAYTHQMLGLSLEAARRDAGRGYRARARAAAGARRADAAGADLGRRLPEGDRCRDRDAAARAQGARAVDQGGDRRPAGSGGSEGGGAAVPADDPGAVSRARRPRAGRRGDETPSIVLYRKNLARAVKTRTELTEQIRDTLLHEIGHLEGLDEDDLRRRGME